MGVRPRWALALVATFVAGWMAGHVPEAWSAWRLEAATSFSLIRGPDAPVLTPNDGSTRIDVLAQGQNAFVGKLVLAPGAQVPRHRDATEEYLHVLSGSGELTRYGAGEESTRMAVRPGDTIFIDPATEISFANGEKPLVALQVFAGPAAAAKYSKWTALAKKGP